MAFEASVQRRIVYSLRPEPISKSQYATQRQKYLDTATGEARETLGGLLQYPEPRNLELPAIDPIRKEHVGKTRQDLATLHHVVHTYSIPDLSPANLQRCTIQSQVASIMRQHVDVHLMKAIQESYSKMREWMQRTGVQIATVHPGGGEQLLFELAGPMDFDPAVDMRKPLEWVPPEKSSAENHWQASVLVRRICSVFFKSFVQEWRRDASEGETYRKLQEWAPITFMLKGKGLEYATPEAIVRSGASTMVEETANSADKLCELMAQAHSVDVLDANNPSYQTSIRDHAGYLAELASFGIEPFSRFAQTVLAGPHKPGTMPKNYKDFLKRFGFILQKVDDQDKEWGDIHSHDCPLIDTYFQLGKTDSKRFVLDINIEKFTSEEITQMLSTGLYTKCHARGQVMKEMLQWFLEIYSKWVLPMFQYESRRG